MAAHATDMGPCTLWTVVLYVMHASHVHDQTLAGTSEGVHVWPLYGIKIVAQLYEGISEPSCFLQEVIKEHTERSIALCSHLRVGLHLTCMVLLQLRLEQH